MQALALRRLLSRRAFSVSSLSHLRGRPPSVDPEAGTFASFYYKHVREFDTPTKDAVVAVAQDERLTVGAFDVSTVLRSLQSPAP
jgi:hypothetical protein